MASTSNTLRRYARDAAGGIGLPRLWRWWSGELAPLVPSASRNALTRWRLRPIVEFTEREVVFWRPEIVNGAVELAALAKAPVVGDAADIANAARGALAAVAADLHGRVAIRPKVVVALPERQVMRKTLTLPAAIEENLIEALSYDLDRHTPFRPEQLYFDAVVVARDAASKTIRVDWVAALKTVVDAAKLQVEGWGAVVQAVVPGPASTQVTRLNLLPSESRPLARAWRRWQVWVPLVLVVGAALAALLVPLVQKREYAIALMKETDDAHVQAVAADAVRSQLERLQSDYNYALTRKYVYPSSVQTLDGVTRVLPDDTWLTQLEMKTTLRGKETQRDIVLRGESANAGKLIGLLEESKLFEQAALRSSTTKVQPGPGEIFDLGAQVTKLPPVIPVPLTAVADAPQAVATMPSGADAAGRAAPPQPNPAGAPPAVAVAPAPVALPPLPPGMSATAAQPAFPQRRPAAFPPAVSPGMPAPATDESAAVSEGGKAAEPASADDDN